MPTFSDEKQERVLESLRETGRELFARQGVRKTTITELTEPAGIGTGTFYQYYDSKEDLYIEILEQYNEELIPRLLQNSFEKYDDPEPAIRALLEETLDELESNPLLQQVIGEGEVAHLRNSVPDEELSGKRARSIEVFLPYLKRWHDQGNISSDPETVAHTLRATTRLVQQKDQIGEDRYPDVKKTLIDAVASGLTRESESTEASDE